MLTGWRSLNRRRRRERLRARYRAFMEEHVYPNEPALDREDEPPTR